MTTETSIRHRLENVDGAGINITIRDGYAIVAIYDDPAWSDLTWTEFDREPIDGHPLSAAATALARHGLTVEHADDPTWERLHIREWLSSDRAVLDVVAKLNDYEGDSIWRDVIYGFGIDKDWTDELDEGRNDVFCLRRGYTGGGFTRDTFRCDPQSGEWYRSYE